MKISFDDYSFIQFSLTPANKILITVAAKDANTTSGFVINSAELTQDQFNTILKELQHNQS